MKPVLLVASVASLVAVAACSGGGNQGPASNGSATTPTGEITVANAYDLRHERFESMGDSMKAINRELKGDGPDVAVIQREAGNLVTLSEQLSSWFPIGSGAEANAKTRAKAEIWGDADGFRRAHEMFKAQTESFQRVAQDGNVEAIRAATDSLGKSCKNCHDTFRGPEK